MTSVVVITPPAEPIVSYEECKAQLRLDHDEDQPYIEALELAAEQHLAGPMGWLGRSIGLQALELRTCDFRWCGMELPYGPFRSVEEVAYEGASGEEAADSAVYVLTGAGTGTAYLRLASGQSWPSPVTGPENVRIRYTAGYEPDDVPAPLKHAILLLVSHWYEHREAVSAEQTYAVPLAVQALASPFRLGFI